MDNIEISFHEHEDGKYWMVSIDKRFHVKIDEFDKVLEFIADLKSTLTHTIDGIIY